MVSSEVLLWKALSLSNSFFFFYVLSFLFCISNPNSKECFFVKSTVEFWTLGVFLAPMEYLLKGQRCLGVYFELLGWDQKAFGKLSGEALDSLCSFMNKAFEVFSQRSNCYVISQNAFLVILQKVLLFISIFIKSTYKHTQSILLESN